jgi:hypothetical protein
VDCPGIEKRPPQWESLLHYWEVRLKPNLENGRVE